MSRAAKKRRQAHPAPAKGSSPGASVKAVPQRAASPLAAAQATPPTAIDDVPPREVNDPSDLVVPAVPAGPLPEPTMPVLISYPEPPARERESRVLLVLAVLAVCYTLFSARAILLPIVVAVLLALTLRPLVRRLRRWRVPESLGAGIVVGSLVAGVGIGGYELFEPARDWLQSAPRDLEKLRGKLEHFQLQFKDFENTSDKVLELAESKNEVEPVEVEIRPSRLSTNVAVVSSTGNFLASTLLVLVLTYFLLASGDALLNNVLQMIPEFGNKRQTVELVYEVERQAASYLLNVSAINLGLGISIGFAMWMFGMPNPALWGVMAALFNFVPFIGAIFGVMVVTFVSLLSFDSPAFAMLPPLTYFLLTTVEGSFITPAILGRSMSLNPILVFLSLAFWGWIWGIGGALLAVPLLAVLKLSLERFERTRPLGLLFSS